MIVDAQIHIWDADRPDRLWPRAGAEGRTAAPQRAHPLGAAEAIAAMDTAGVARAILVPPSWEGDRNDLALAAVTAHPGRFGIMGRISPDPSHAHRLCAWRDQPGMLGIRIILAAGNDWSNQGMDHWLWRAAADAGIPLTIAPAGNMSLLADIAKAFPALRLTIDHMGARVHQAGEAAFADMDAVIALASLPHVSVKATALPCYSDRSAPWPDIMPNVRRLFDAFGPERLFWGSDLSRLPCPYADLVEVFRTGLPWLSGEDANLVMGDALRRWLNWS